MGRDLGEKGKSALVWGSTPAGSAHAKGATRGSKEYFERVLARRNGYEIMGLLELIPFSAFCNKGVLEIGCGAGYDAFELCRHGSNYTGLDIAHPNLVLTQMHLKHYGYDPSVLRGDAEDLPFRGRTFDIVYSNGVLHHTPDTEKAFYEAYRVLKKGGEFWVAVYHKNSIFYWGTLFLFDHILGLGFLSRTFKERLSMIEYTESSTRPLVKAFSRHQLKGMLSKTGFSVEFLWVRKLVLEDLPGIPILNRLWHWIPQKWLRLLGNVFGWYVITKAVKK
jgi:ubiquinone/menaquinone biosynthesis C-methylase UbiE